LSKKKEKEKNPLHTEYGILSNVFYVLKKIKQYKPVLLILMAIGVVTNSLMQYLWSFIGKFVIDIVQAQSETPQKDISPLITLLIITTLVEFISMGLNTFTDNKRWYLFINVRMKVMTERIRKVLSMNYQMLEKPDILDMAEKAANATGGNNNGIEGLMHSTYQFMVQLVLVIVTMTVVIVLDWRLLIALAVISFLQFLFFRYTVKKDKKEALVTIIHVFNRPVEGGKWVKLKGLKPEAVYRVNDDERLYTGEELMYIGIYSSAPWAGGDFTGKLYHVVEVQ
jgi:ABC-type multidrug transport system fused ATPase/permease subunit